MFRTVLAVLVAGAAVAPASAQFTAARWVDRFDSYSTGNLTEQSSWKIVDQNCPFTCGDALINSTKAFSSPNDITVVDATTVIWSFVDNPVPGMNGPITSGQWCFSGWAWVDKNNPKGAARVRLCYDDNTLDPKVGSALVFDGSDGKNEKVFLDGYANEAIVMPVKTWFRWTLAVDLDRGLVSAYANDETIAENKPWNGPLEIRGIWLYGGPGFTNMKLDDFHLESAWGDATHILGATPNPVPAGATDIALTVRSTGWTVQGVTDPRGVLFFSGLDYTPFLDYVPVDFLPLALDGAGDDAWKVALPPGLSGTVLELRGFFVGTASNGRVLDSLGNYLQVRFD